MITAIELTKKYGRTMALQGVSFNIRRGAVAALVGPNGAGKSSVLRILAGLAAPADGSATIGGVDVQEDPLEVRQMMVYLPEDSPVYRDLRVGEFFRFRAALRSLSGRLLAKRMRLISNALGLSGLIRVQMSHLSRGEARRVLVADCLIQAPEVLLLDEPTLGVDAEYAARIRGLLCDLGSERTVLVTAHTVAEVQSWCGEIIRIEQGRVLPESTGTPGGGGV